MCVSLLLRGGANTELVRHDGYTALHLAAETGGLECAALLVDAAACVDHPYPIGWTALTMAASHGHVRTLHM